MKNNKIITVLVILISIFAVSASLSGIFITGGPGPYDYVSLRGKVVEIYGYGLYRDMSSDVAIQGIAQDYVTLFIAVPLLIAAWYFSRKNSLSWRFILAGTLNYFFVTYIMYMCMAMYNAMFLIYVILTGISFFSLAITLLSFDTHELPGRFNKKAPLRLSGGFLILNSIIIGLLWLGIVIPPLFNGTIVPDSAEHYTTLIVQGLDLSIFLPASFVSGYLLTKKNSMGFLLAPTTLIFLSLLMTALLAKIIAMGLNGVNIIPAVFIIPVILLTSIILSERVLRNINSSNPI